jgi:hypothetical protein
MGEHVREPFSTRLSWEEAHRLELTLRARARTLSGRGHVGRCPGCGETVLDEDDHMRVGGLVVHPSCLFVCRDDPPAAA